MVSRATKDFELTYRRIREDIFEFCKALNFEPTWQQREVLQAVQDGNGHPTYISVKSGQGTGKTTVSVVICLWRAIQAPGALVVLTAPTMRQCRDVFLAEARRILAKADAILRKIVEVTGSRIDILGGRQGPMKIDWGVSTVTATDERNAQGYHEKHLTIMLEEFSGIPRPLVTQFKGTVSNEDVLMMGIGNPNLRDCAMFDTFNSLRDEWQTFTFDAEELSRRHPEIRRPSLNEALEREFGRDSDVYRIRVLGEFPFTDPDCVIGSELLEQATRMDMLAMSKIERNEGGAWRRARQFGTDLARFGGDENVIYQRLGNAIIDQWIGAHVDPNKVVDRSFAMQVGSAWSNDSTTFVTDAGGMGQGVMNNYYAAKRMLFEFHNNGTAHNSAEYENLITEAWFNMARMAKAHQLYLPKDNRLIKQLSGRRYTTNKKGKLVIWSNDEWMHEGNESADRANACVMALYDSVVVGGRHVRQHAPQKRGMVIR